MAEDQITLKIGGQVFGGWTQIEVSRGLDQFTGSFRVALTERFPDHPEQWIIAPGQGAEVFIGADKVITGWIDEGEWSIDENSHAVSISGRDITGDLVDCSAVHKPGSWSGGTLEHIANELTAPFGIRVTADASTGATFKGGQVQPKGKGGLPKTKASKVGRFSVQQSETVYEALDRLAKQRAVLLTTNEDGDVELRRPGLTRASYGLVLGVNLKTISFTNDVKDRFSDYTVKGHPVGGDYVLDTASSAPSAKAKDPGVTRYRPLVILNEDTASGASLADRARWEASIRAGKARKATATVQGWRTPDGDIYRVDRLVRVQAPLVGVDADLLLAAVKFTQGLQGRTTELTLAPATAYQLIDQPAPKGAKGKGVDWFVQ